MHPTSLENMGICRDRHVTGEFLAARDKTMLLDIGAFDVNGTYREIFTDPRIDYVGADLQAGPGVDLVLQDPYALPLDDGSVDIVLCGQMLEHCAYFWRAFAEMVRVLRPGGFLFLIAPSTGPIHRYPVDCYRFYPDAYRALARFADCHLAELWLDERGRWQDLVGVFTRRWLDALPANDWDRRADELLRKALEDGSRTAPEWRCSGEAHYLDTLRDIHRAFAPRRYLEIGVDRGRSLALASCPSVGVDPSPRVDRSLPENATVVETKSDEFFASGAAAEDRAFDLVFIDGEHKAESALRDFMHAEQHLAPHGLIVFDDIYPNHAVQARAIQGRGLWSGDVWKLVSHLQGERPDLLLVPINTAPTGLLLVAGAGGAAAAPLKPIAGDAGDPPAEILSRRGALSPSDPRLGELCRLLREARETAQPPHQALARAGEIFAAA